MKKYILTEYIEQCYTCHFMEMTSEIDTTTIIRTWACRKVDKEICKGILSKLTRSYIEKPIIHTDGWFPDWCPLEDVEDQEMVK